MPRIFMLSLVVAGLFAVISLPLRGDDVTVAPRSTGGDIATLPDDQHIGVTFNSQAPGNLFLHGHPLQMEAVLSNPGGAFSAKVVIRIATPMGCEVSREAATLTLPAHDKLVRRVTFAGSDQLPNGSYTVEVWVEGERMGYGMTNAGVWNGPLEKASNFFGISYAGPLSTERTQHDLDLFKQAGVGWLRFPMLGWQPGGNATPLQAADYDSFVQEAATKRKFNLLAAFVPQMAVDPATNPAQAGKEYRESLLAAATRYRSQVKYWELLRVRPDPSYTELKGIKFGHLRQGREALRTLDRTLNVIYTLEYPCKWNAQELFDNKMPAEGDLIGMQYNFVGTPETQTNPPQPIYDLPEVRAAAHAKLKRVPPVWVTEYGFDPAKGSHLPKAVYQAALVARAIILDRVSGIERTFWRHNPDSLFDLPLTCGDGSVQPGLLAVRTTLETLDGATACMPLPAPEGVRAYLFQFGASDPKHQDGAKPHYRIAAWIDKGQPLGVAMKTHATAVSTWDLWGNSLDIRPTENTAIFQVDEFPRFIDMGEWHDVAQLSMAFVHCDPSRVVLRDDQQNKVMIGLINDQQLIKGPISCELHFSRWPDDANADRTEKVDLLPYARKDLTRELPIPTGAVKGQVYTINIDIMMGTRRVGFLTVPVLYEPSTARRDRRDR